MNNKFLTTIVLSIICSYGFSQNIDEITIRRHAVEKVGQLNDYIAFMVSKKKSVDNRLHYKEKALNLFIGKGYKYEENGIDKEGVMMEVTSKSKEKIKHILLRDYFHGLVYGLGNYSNYKIDAVEIIDIKVSDLRKIDTNKWVCTCQYDQAFEGYHDGRPSYRHIAPKSIKCIVTAEETEDGWELISLFGDVYAISTM